MLWSASAGVPGMSIGERVRLTPCTRFFPTVFFGMMRRSGVSIERGRTALPDRDCHPCDDERAGQYGAQSELFALQNGCRQQRNDRNQDQALGCDTGGERGQGIVP